jgi:hypothetical protein
MKIHVLDQAEDDLVDGYYFYENQTSGFWIVSTQILTLSCLMLAFIRFFTRITEGCCQKNFLLQFIIPFQEM